MYEDIVILNAALFTTLPIPGDFISSFVILKLEDNCFFVWKAKYHQFNWLSKFTLVELVEHFNLPLYVVLKITKELKMSEIFCPKCESLQNITESTSVIPIIYEDGEITLVTYINIFCDNCGTFLSSEKLTAEAE